MSIRSTFMSDELWSTLNGLNPKIIIEHKIHIGSDLDMTIYQIITDVSTHSVGND